MGYLKRLSLIAVITIFVVSCSKSDSSSAYTDDTPAEKARVTWYNFTDGLKLAKAGNRPLIIDFYADWCRWCKVMDNEIFSDKEIVDRLEKNYVCIRVYTDRDHDEVIRFKNHVLTKQEFTVMLGVQGLPTVVFMDKDENLITKIPGYVKKDVFLPLLNYMKDECYKQNIPFQDYREGKSPCSKR